MKPRHILYISYNGLSEPLVQSQVLPYLRHLVPSGFKFSLLTFERNDSTAGLSPGEIEPGVYWQPVAQRRSGLGRPRALLDGYRLARAAVRQGRAGLVHARSYLPAMIAMLACRGARTPWIFDMRGFWVDEKVLKGRLQAGSLRFRLLKRIEKALLRDCAALVSLTRKALPEIRRMTGLDRLPPHRVISTCVDLEHFRPHDSVERAGKPLTFAYVGSVGPGYDGEGLADFLYLALERFPQSRAIVISRSDESQLRSLRDRLQRFEQRLEFTQAEYKEMPRHLRAVDIGLSFITPHYSKHASAATKVAEYLACGAYVIANRGIGDIDAILADPEIGMAIEMPGGKRDALGHLHGAREIAATRPLRRAFAERHFNVITAAGEYGALYREVLEQQAERIER